MALFAKGVPRLQSFPAVVAIAGKPWGRLILVLLFSALGYVQGQHTIALGVTLTLLSLWPSRRRILVAAATAYWLLAYHPTGENRVAIGIVGLGACAVLTLFQRRPDHWVFARPVRNLLVLYIALMAAASYLPLAPLVKLMVWVVLAVGGKYLWFMAYALSDRKGARRQRPLVSFFRFHPFWSAGPFLASNVPFPKGEANLAQIEAKNSEELAVCQLRGIELMVWSTILLLSMWAFNFALKQRSDNGYELNAAIGSYLKGKPLPRLDCWLAVVTNFIRKLLETSWWGGSVHAMCRMAGFNAVRNTRKPLSSRTIAEFYNRVYYYFKELLVTFFFYPTYFRYFKDRPQLRVFVATLAAAGFGNALYHFLRDTDHIFRVGLLRAMVDYQVYFVYTLILGVAIAVSQLRSMNGQTKGGRLTGPLCVLTFYCLVMVLDNPPPERNVRDYFSFIINLFVPFPR